MTDEKTIIADPGELTHMQQGSSKTRACLIQYNGAHLGKRYILDETEVVIGRHSACNIVIQDQSVSRQHARCSQSQEVFSVEDLGTTNGTYLNDGKIDGKVTLKDGDIIRLGNVLLKYFSQDNVENVFHDKIYRMATIDGGTQIFNKKYLMESLESEVKFAKSFGKPLSIIYFDLDHFKAVNDTHGHNTGDYILKETAALVQSTIRKTDIFGRFGGEEFVIILPNSDAKTAYDFAERIRTTVADFVFQFEGKSLKQTISLGVSQFDSSMSDVGGFLDDADKKLYNSKQSGRNKVTV